MLRKVVLVLLVACGGPRAVEGPSNPPPPPPPPTTAAVVAPAPPAPPAPAPPPVEEPVDENAGLPDEAKPFGVKASELDTQVKKLGDLTSVGGQMVLMTKIEADHAIGTADEPAKTKARKAAAAAYAELRKKFVALAKDITAQRKLIAGRKKTDDGPHWATLDERLRSSASTLKDIGIQYRSALDKPDKALEKLLADAAK